MHPSSSAVIAVGGAHSTWVASLQSSVVVSGKSDDQPVASVRSTFVAPFAAIGLAGSLQQFDCPAALG